MAKVAGDKSGLPFPKALEPNANEVLKVIRRPLVASSAQNQQRSSLFVPTTYHLHCSLYNVHHICSLFPIFHIQASTIYMHYIQYTFNIHTSILFKRCIYAIIARWLQPCQKPKKKMTSCISYLLPLILYLLSPTAKPNVVSSCLE